MEELYKQFKDKEFVFLAISVDYEGMKPVRDFIEKKEPDIVLCGHIHEAKGIDRIRGTVIVNPGPVRHGNCATASFDNKIEVKLDSV
jgi:Icc-related predicted phosphoesterase